MSIQITNLSKTFEDGKKALNNVTITFKKNKITGLIGFNGSGKTTTFNILADFIEDFEGEFLIDGQPITRNTLRKISYLAAGAEPKNPIKVIKHFNMIGELYGLNKLEVKKIVDPLAKRMEFTELLNKPIKALSKGNQQKIKVISALLNPEIEYLFLDEPFDGLDPIMVEKIKLIFMELKNITIILTSHRMEVVQSMCEEFFVLKEGVLVDSRKTDDKSIFVEVNKEIDISKYKDNKIIIKIIENSDNENHTFKLDDIEHFKKLNELLIKDNNFKYISLKEKNIADSIFRGEDI